VGWAELPAAVSRLQETLQGLQRELTQTRRELDALRAAQWYAQTPLVNGRRVVTATLPDADLERLRTIAGFIAELPGGIAIIAGGTERPQIVVACADDTAVDAREILAVGMKVLGGRGGGHARMAQGGGGQMSLLAAAIAAMMERASVA
jgi:alanyl-tRNA synthetase